MKKIHEAFLQSVICLQEILQNLHRPTSEIKLSLSAEVSHSLKGTVGYEGVRYEGEESGKEGIV